MPSSVSIPSETSSITASTRSRNPPRPFSSLPATHHRSPSSVSSSSSPPPPPRTTISSRSRARLRSDYPPPSPPTEHEILRLRTYSLTSLRFRQTSSPHHLVHPYSRHHPTSHLVRLLLAPTPLFPPPALYLRHYPPAENTFHSLLALLAAHPLPAVLHSLLLTAATHPHRPATSAPLAPKDAVALHFTRAVTACPPRIPVELRTAFRTMHPPDRALHIALLLSFSAYYSTVASLLGLAVRQTADNPISYHDFPEMTEPSEMSAPSSTTHSTSSPHFSLSARLSFAARNSLDRLANPLRLKLAKHSTHHLERTTWLSAIPTTRRSQDDFICASMGFTPEYLKDLRSTAHRATFIYIIDEILLKDSSHGLSTAVKNLACFILASSTENSVLTAHSAFLANRFGAHDRQLSACMDISLLQEMQKAYEGHCPPSVVESASESSSFASSEEDEIRPAPPPARRRRRGDRFRFPEFSDGSSRVIDRCDAEVADYGDCLQDEGQACKNEYMMDVVDDVNTGDVRKKRLRRGFDDRKEGLSEFQRRRMRCYTHMDELDEEKEHEEHDMDLSDSESDSSEQSVGDYDLVDNIEVPEVNGLNAMRPDQEGFENRDLNKDMDKFSKYEDFEIAEDGSKEGEEELDMSLFSLKEVTFLLLSHEVAQGSRRNSRVCSKYAEAKPDALVSSELAKLIHSTFEKEAIMEMVSVIAAFNMLQRWTVCYPYKPGTLEGPVRRFVQTPIAHDLCVDAVGQRSSSRYSIMLRVQTGRALRLPRHAVVAPVEAM